MSLRVLCKLLHRSGNSRSVPSVKRFNHQQNDINISKYSTLIRDETIAFLEGKLDRHNGVHVHLADVDPKMSPKEFNDRLQASISDWKNRGLLAAWLNIPIFMSGLIPVAAQHGFAFHHAEGHASSMYCWLEEKRKSSVPKFASHQVGVAGCVINEDKLEVLMIQDKKNPVSQRTAFWKFPGGLSELGEDISETAEREVFEETGLTTEFQGIMGFRQQHNMPNAFGRSDLFFVCHMKPTSFELHPDYDHEISRCQWMKIDHVKDMSATSPITQTICQLLEHGLTNGFSSVHLASKRLKSLYKGVPFKMYFSRALMEGSN